MIRSLELQDFIFEKNASRLEYKDFTSALKKTFTICVYRNHSFELIENTIQPYLEFAGLGVNFIYSDYDDSLSFVNLDDKSDLLILWLDVSRYAIPDFESFVADRIKYLQGRYKKNIVFVPLGGGIAITSDQVVTYPISKVKDKFGGQFLDQRMEPYSGTKLSALACMEISRELGLKYIPALLRPNLKGVIVDLDNTLYCGVLGEDGAKGVVLTEEHRRLQLKLKDLSKQGFFLCIASKNDQGDVIDLFNSREDFPLKIEDFTKVYAGWHSKADSITEIVKFLNVSSESLLFVDDNMGEVVTVLQSHPDISVILAKEDAQLTLNVLNDFPGLFKLDLKKEDALRKDDVKANEKRKEIQNNLSKEDYIKSLEIELAFDVNNLDHAKRVAELANKTNQFIFTFRRYSLQSIQDLMKSPNSAVVSVSLKDKLSDSGIIGVVVIVKNADAGLLDECFVSCRALGRGIDDVIVLGAIKLALASVGAGKLKVQFEKGERNLPAENFLKERLSKYVESDDFDFNLPKDFIKVVVR